MGILFAALLVGAMVGGYMLSRDVPFDFQPDVMEANSFRKALVGTTLAGAPEEERTPRALAPMCG